jgi:Aspartate/tyrosine/aromatic aminotransferase
MTGFSSRVERISISGIREVFEAAGDDAINLGLGQPDFPTPDHARQAAVDAIQSGEADGYTGNKGIEPLREAIAAKHERDQGIDIDPADVIATSGASEALHLALEAHVDPGQEVIIPDPGFVSYDALTKLADGEPVPVGLREDLTPDPAAIEDAITDDTAAFIVNSPANPTGAVASEDDIQEFARIADEHDVLCVSDEVYEYTVFDGTHHSPIEYADGDNVVVVNSSSKLYSMTGWRLGWVTGASERVDRMLRVHQYVQACASAPAQYAAEAALTGPQGIVDEIDRLLRTPPGHPPGWPGRPRHRLCDPPWGVLCDAGGARGVRRGMYRSRCDRRSGRRVRCGRRGDGPDLVCNRRGNAA